MVPQECTCANVDFGLNPTTGKPSLTCMDDEAEGRSKTFACGVNNYRGREGHDEFRSGMRSNGACLCSTTPGKLVHDACFQFKTKVGGDEFVFPPRCLPVVHVSEDKWSYISGRNCQKYPPPQSILLLKVSSSSKDALSYISGRNYQKSVLLLTR